MDLEQAIAVLMGHSDRNAVIKALNDSAQPIYQAIFDKGHGSGYGKKAGEVSEVQAALDKATADLKAREDELATLKASQPEASKLHDQYKAEIEGLKTAHKDAVKKLKEAISGERLSRAQADLRAKLTSADKAFGDQILDAAYADVLVQHPDTVKRLKFGEDGTLEVLQAGKDIPLQVSDGQAPLNLLAAEIKASANPKLIVSTVDRGSGTSGTTGTPSGTPNLYDSIRENAKKAQEARKPSTTAAERMGMTTGA